MLEVAPSIDHLLGGTAADSQLETPAGDEIGGARIFRHVGRVLIPHVDDRRANFDPSRPGSDRGKQGERRRQLPRKVMNPKVSTVHSQALGLYGKVNGLQQRVRRRPRLGLRGGGPMTEGEKANFLHETLVYCVVRRLRVETKATWSALTVRRARTHHRAAHRHLYRAARAFSLVSP